MKKFYTLLTIAGVYDLDDFVVVIEYILEGPDLCAGFSEDKEMNRLVAPLTSESMDLAIELCKRRFQKRKENKNEKNL